MFNPSPYLYPNDAEPYMFNPSPVDGVVPELNPESCLGFIP